MHRLETKAAFNIDQAGAITGTAWPFGTPDRVGDMVEKGAFAGVRLPIPMLFAHDPTQPVGTWDDATETGAGLIVKGRLLIEHVERAREVRALVHSGAIGGLSIGFSTRKAVGRTTGGRTITALDLVEISLVTIPMHPGAKITSAKSASSAIQLAEALNRAALALRNER